MSPAEGIAKHGFRRWYERELIEGHVYLVTCILSLMLIAACLEQIDWRGPLVQLVFTRPHRVGGAICTGVASLHFYSRALTFRRAVD